MDRIDFNFDFGPLFGFILFGALLALVFMIWMLVDAIRRPEEDFGPGGRTGWVVGLAVGLFLSVIGFAIAVAYFFSVRLPARRRGRSGASQGSPGFAPPVPPPRGTQAPIPTTCRSCGAKLLAGARYCHSCGAPTIDQPEGS